MIGTIVGDVAQAVSTALTKSPESLSAAEKEETRNALRCAQLGLVGAVAGGILGGKKHWLLGSFAGSTVYVFGDCASGRPYVGRIAASNLVGVMSAAAVMDRSWKMQLLAYLGGFAAAQIAQQI